MAIMIADDNDQMRRLLVRALTKAGYQAVAVSGVDDLFQACRHKAPEAVISDIFMPDGDGVKACLALRRRYPDLPVVMMTSDPLEAERARTAGFADVLLKPFDLQELRKVLRELLSK